MSRHLFRCFACLLGLYLALAFQLARAEPAQATFSIPDVWPWAYESESGEQGGSLIELANRLSDVSGIPVKTELRPLRRVVLEITSGDVGFTFLFRSRELDENAVPVAKVIDVNLLLLAMADTDYPLSLRKLARQRVSFISGSYLGEAFEDDTDVVKVPVASVGQAMDLLMTGRIAAILASDHNILRTVEARGLRFSQFRYSKHVEGQPAMLYRSASGSHPGHGAKFARALETMKQSGELQQIFFGPKDRVPSFSLLTTPHPPQQIAQ